MTWMHVLTIVGSSVSASLIALIGLSVGGTALMRRGRKSIFTDFGASCVFLFDQTELVDASEEARALLAVSSAPGDAWARLLAFLSPHFPGFEEKFARLQDVGRITLSSGGAQPMTLRAEWRGGLARIMLRAPGGDLDRPAGDALSHRAMEEEIEALRGTMDRAPFPAWRQDPTGAVVWANRAYLDLASQRIVGSDTLPWPLPPLFPEVETGWTSTRRRASLSLPNAAVPRWFDLQGFPQGTEDVVFALPADAAVEAETSLRSFLQTLTKTFAHLATGLAIFDRQRQLALFNPALIDLTGLAPEFLSTRPTMFAMLDAMREAQMIPEPKDYKGWRNEMMALEQAAASGQYEETWSLPNGQTYRVIGRPHPDGAVALLFDDISAEMTLTRRFRADMETGHAVVDTLDEAIAVFSPAGRVVLTNAAYDRMWGGEPIDIAAAASGWQAGAAPGPIWAAARAFVVHSDGRLPWTGEARLLDGRLLSCRFTPLPGGASLIGFTPVLAVLAAQPKPHADAKRQTA
ncbi:MAG: PAS domain-containing protein [Rhodobacteraceae bacterium]|nr:PAS domain-containing protein [Paracoccaceae bacterium]